MACRLLTALVIFYLAFSIPAAKASAQANLDPPSNFERGIVIVKFKQGAPARDLARALEVVDGSYGRPLAPDLRRYVVPQGQELETVAQLRKDPAIEYAELDWIATVDWSPDDPKYVDGTQWGLQRISPSFAWDLTKGEGITVAVVDTGVDLSHPDLAANVIAGYDFANNDGDPRDDNGHGTHVAGIVAAQGNNGVGGLGVAPAARIMPIKALFANGSGYYSDIVEAIRYAADNGARVINMSLGGSADSQSLREAVDYAWSRGAAVVAAAGNSNSSNLYYPAAYANSIAVAATTSTDVKASFSSYGSHVDIAAPGATIYSTLPGSYGSKSGTSMATPFVSGAAALALAAGACHSVDNAAARQGIQSGADNIDALNPDYVGRLGSGRLNLSQSFAKPPSITASSNAITLSTRTGDEQTQQRTITLSGSCAASWLASTTQLTLPSWLSLTTSTSPTPTLTLTASAANLAAGQYSATVTLRYPSRNAPQIDFTVDLSVASETTPTPTATPSSTPSATATPTPTSTPTATSTATATATPTPTMTPTVTPTATLTSTNTPTPTSTATATAAPTPTATPTPTPFRVTLPSVAKDATNGLAEGQGQASLWEAFSLAVAGLLSR